MKFTLLTHEKERNRKDNTGDLLCQLSGCAIDNTSEKVTAQKILWQRKQPDAALVEQLMSGQAVLLTPDGGGEAVTDISAVEHLVILDGTWQEARKMFNKSEYLKQAKWLGLKNPPVSRYTLRRNQLEGGLCTIECAIEVLKLKGMTDSVTKLNDLYHAFLANIRR